MLHVGVAYAGDNHVVGGNTVGGDSTDSEDSEVGVEHPCVVVVDTSDTLEPVDPTNP